MEVTGRPAVLFNVGSAKSRYHVVVKRRNVRVH